MIKASCTSLLLASLATTISTQSLAGDFSITKEEQPNRMLVLSSAGGMSIETFSILHMDLRNAPPGADRGSITSVEYV